MGARGNEVPILTGQDEREVSVVMSRPDLRSRVCIRRSMMSARSHVTKVAKCSRVAHRKEAVPLVRSALIALASNLTVWPPC